MQTVVSQTSPPKKSFLYDPKVRGIFYQVVLVAVVVFLFYVAATNAIENLQRAKIASGFGFLEQHGRLRHQPDADPVQRRRLDLWRCLHRRPAQHPARLGHRHRLRDVPRLRRRHRAPVQELDGGEGGDGLCRGAPQHSAAAAAAVLVHRRARPLPQPRNSLELGAGFFLNSRGLFMPRPLCAADAWLILVTVLVIGLVGTFLYRRWARKQQEQTGRQYPVGMVTLALGPRPADPDLDRAGARRRQPDHLRHAAQGHVQPARRHADPAGIRGAAPRPRHLYGGLHRRGRPRRHPRGLERADGGRRLPRPAARARPCASWSSRRPCASSSRR